MTYLQRMARLEEWHGLRTAPSPIVEKIRADPAEAFALAGMTPDPWQVELLRNCPNRLQLLASRQVGKSTGAAALAVNTALLEAPALVLLLSPTLRQSGELFRKVCEQYRRLGCPAGISAVSATRLEMGNGSRIVSLPGSERNIRSYSGPKLILIDEAARVPNDVYAAARPMLATVREGKLVALTTAFAKQGWFFDAWEKLDSPWHKVKVPATECPRISADFLAEERDALGLRWYLMEYGCEFADAIDSLFSLSDIQRAVTDDVAPLFGGSRT